MKKFNKPTVEVIKFIPKDIIVQSKELCEGYDCHPCDWCTSGTTGYCEVYYF